ncbi:MAG: hypothetical protein AAFO84_13600 [Cyanobacteria bacterium J06598_1]
MTSLPRFCRVFFGPAVAVGCVLMLGSCGSDSTMPTAQPIVYDEIDKDLYVQPIQVCDDFGQNCARMNLFADLTAGILEQAKLSVNFLPANQLNSSRLLHIGDEKNGTNELYELSRKGEAADYGRHEDSTRTTGPINVWFVDSILSDNGNTQFGSAWVDANGVIISEATLDFNGGKGRADTLAHEIAHNLGLRHTTLGAGGANNLVTDGNKRNVPGSVNDVYPNGAKTSQLTAAQIQEILDSGFVTQQSSDAIAPHEADLAHYHPETDSVHHHPEADLAHHHPETDLAHHVADLAQVSLLSLHASHDVSFIQASSEIPESSSSLALGAIALSSMLLLKRQTPKMSRSA